MLTCLKHYHNIIAGYSIFRFWNSVFLTKVANFLYATPPTFDKAYSKECISNIRIMWKRAMFLNNIFGSPIFRKNTIIADVKFILINTNLYWNTSRKILMNKCIENNLTHGIHNQAKRV